MYLRVKTELNWYFFPIKTTWAETGEQKMNGSQPRHKGQEQQRKEDDSCSLGCPWSAQPLELFCSSVMTMYTLIPLHGLVVNLDSPLVRRATVVCSSISPHSCRTHSLKCSALLFMPEHEFWPSQWNVHSLPPCLYIVMGRPCAVRTREELWYCAIMCCLLNALYQCRSISSL